MDFEPMMLWKLQTTVQRDGATEDGSKMVTESVAVEIRLVRSTRFTSLPLLDKLTSLGDCI